MLPAKGKNKGKKSLDRVSENGLGLRDEDDLFFQQDGFEDADDGWEGQKLEDAVDGSFLLKRRNTEMMG